MKNISIIFFIAFLLSCKSEEVIIDNVKPTEKAFVAFSNFTSKSQKVIEYNIPLEFSIENRTKKEIVVPNICDFSLMLNTKYIKSGYNLPDFFKNRNEKSNSEFVIKPKEKINIKIYYLFGITNNSENDENCIFDMYSEKLKKSDTIYIEKNDDICLEKISKHLYNNTYSTLHYYKEGSNIEKKIKILNKKFD